MKFWRYDTLKTKAENKEAKRKFRNRRKANHRAGKAGW